MPVLRVQGDAEVRPQPTHQDSHGGEGSLVPVLRVQGDREVQRGSALEGPLGEDSALHVSLLRSECVVEEGPQGSRFGARLMRFVLIYLRSLKLQDNPPSHGELQKNLIVLRMFYHRLLYNTIIQ